MTGTRISGGRWRFIAAVCIAILVGGAIASSRAADLKITLPRRSQPTAVQRLNRDGVQAIRKHDYEKAKTLFYRAYLLDPDDPFTLNNLGYISELEGQAERAQSFYALASQQATDAFIDRASTPAIRGESAETVIRQVASQPMQINHANLEAVRLLSAGRAPEAELVLDSTLKIDPKNVFTLNNLGVAREMDGDFARALECYTAAAQADSGETATVTLSRAWRGKPLRQVASENAKRLRAQIESRERGSVEAQAGRLNLRGVVALNRNDPDAARRYFRQGYALDPGNAFSLNNMGYLSEMDGDPETAQFFYQRAQNARGARAPVGLATRRAAEGMRLFQVADGSDRQVDRKMAQESQARRQSSAPIQLKHRDQTPVVEPSAPPTSEGPNQEQKQEQNKDQNNDREQTPR